MLGILVPGELEEMYVATEVSKRVVGLGVSETELKLWNTGEAPGGPTLSRKLRRDPELKNFRLTVELVIVFTVVDGRKARNVYFPRVVVLVDALGEKISDPHNLEDLVGSLNLGFLLVSQATPRNMRMLK